MSTVPVSVSIVPRHTLESESLAVVLRAAGVPVDDPDAESTLQVVALPRASRHRIEEVLDGTPHPNLLLVAEGDDSHTAALAQALHSSGVVSWRKTVAELVSTVRSVAEGGSMPVASKAHSKDPFAQLTARERDVIGLVSLGRSDDQVATLLGISSNTVRTHVQHVLAKLQVSHRHAAAALARKSPLMLARTAWIPSQRSGKAAS
jgi:DNA-binding NarL/FixJ family response regulator